MGSAAGSVESVQACYLSGSGVGSEAGYVGLSKRVTSQAVVWVVQLGICWSVQACYLSGSGVGSAAGYVGLSKRVTSQAVVWVVQLGLLVCPSMLPLRQWRG